MTKVSVVTNKNGALMGIFAREQDAKTWISHTEGGYDEYGYENIVVIEEYVPFTEVEIEYPDTIG